MNVDEARFNGKTDGPMYTVIESALRGRHNHVSALCSAGFTVITFLSADGNPCLFVIILAAAFNEDGTAAINVPLLKPGRTRSGGVDLLYAFTASGYINGPLWASVMDHFCTKWSMANPGLECLLFSDQLRAHRDPVVVAKALGHSVRMFSLVPGTSHWLQPMDSFCFANMKRSVAADHMKRVLAEKIADLPTADLLIISFYEVARRAFGSRVGQKSFREIGLYHYNPELIRALADQFHGYLGGTASMPQQCIAVCTETINLRLAGNKRTATTMQARLCVREQVYGPEELIARSERYKELAELKAKHKADDLAARECRAPDCSSHQYSSKRWQECPHCDWRLCPSCRRAQAGLWSEHSAACRGDAAEEVSRSEGLQTPQEAESSVGR